ncbi:MAG: hypothetical protein V4773_17025 [Verrucomicrobiota bacterium]
MALKDILALRVADLESKIVANDATLTRLRNLPTNPESQNLERFNAKHSDYLRSTLVAVRMELDRLNC